MIICYFHSSRYAWMVKTLASSSFESQGWKQFALFLIICVLWLEHWAHLNRPPTTKQYGKVRQFLTNGIQFFLDTPVSSASKIDYRNMTRCWKWHKTSYNPMLLADFWELRVKTTLVLKRNSLIGCIWTPVSTSEVISFISPNFLKYFFLHYKRGSPGSGGI